MWQLQFNLPANESVTNLWNGQLARINDDPSEIFTLANAQQLTTFSQQHGIGELSMWELPRDLTGTLGAADATTGSGIAQTPFELSQIFEQIAGAPQT